MVKMFSAFTEQVDDVDVAVAEVMDTLNVGGGILQQSTIGILHCHADFIETGVVKALCEKLPFDVVGISTTTSASAGIVSSIGLTISVLTSNDIRFVSGISAPVDDDLSGVMGELYGRVVTSNEGKPGLLMPFVPFLLTFGGDEFVAELDKLSGGIPAFGTLSISENLDFSNCYTIYNGEAFGASLALVALFGDVQPAFLTTTINHESILTVAAIVTGATKNILHSINDMPAEDYIESIGLAHKGELNSLSTTPLVINLEDGSVLIRACIMGDGKGGAVLCGHIPVGSHIRFALIEADDILRSAKEKTHAALDTANGRAILMYSCAARIWALGVNNLAELTLIEDIIGDKAPYYCVCSGGEIFPQWLRSGKVVNHLQNNSLIMCIL